MSDVIKYVLLGILLALVVYAIVFILSIFGVITVNAESAICCAGYF